MIAIAVSLLIALYILGPDAVSRVVIGFTLPRRNLILTRSEEITRALVWSASSFLVAYAWCHAGGTWQRIWQPASLQTFFAGLYSEEFFRTHQGAWFSSLHPLFSFNVALLTRMYAVVLLCSLLLAIATHFYGVLRDRLPPWPWLRNALAAALLPRVAQWHIVLSNLLLGDHDLYLMVDVLTKSDKLYQGELSDKVLAADGSLISLALKHPRRFDRAGYLQANEGPTKFASQDFWKPIPSDMFLVLASDMHTLNVRYVPRGHSVQPLKSGSPELVALLQSIAEQVQAAQQQVAPASPTHES